MPTLQELDQRLEEVEGKTNHAGNSRRGSIPIGGIILWSGAVIAIPANWHLCDGDSGTPNLQDQFVIGAGSTYAVAATGGGLSANHGFTQPTAHATHTAHGTNLTAVQAGTGTNITEFNGSNEANHAAHTENHTGGAVTGAHTLPPYYALCYIMRIG